VIHALVSVQSCPESWTRGVSVDHQSGLAFPTASAELGERPTNEKAVSTPTAATGTNLLAKMEPALLQILASGRALNATLYVIVGSAPSGRQPNYLGCQLTTVGLVGDSLAQGGSDHANGLVKLTFQYGSQTVIANVANASGTVQQTSSCWNTVTNASCLPTSY
jgi:hypothetical protein